MVHVLPLSLQQDLLLLSLPLQTARMIIKICFARTQSERSLTSYVILVCRSAGSSEQNIAGYHATIATRIVARWHDRHDQPIYLSLHSPRIKLIWSDNMKTAIQGCSDWIIDFFSRDLITIESWFFRERKNQTIESTKKSSIKCSIFLCLLFIYLIKWYFMFALMVLGDRYSYRDL